MPYSAPVNGGNIDNSDAFIKIIDFINVTLSYVNASGSSEFQPIRSVAFRWNPGLLEADQGEES